MNNTVLIAAPISKTFEHYLISKALELSTNFLEETLYAKTIGIVTSTKLNLQKPLLDKFPNLKWIARLGSGLEIIDMQECTTRAISVFNAPYGIANAVAEHTVAMLVALQKNIVVAHNQVANFNWLREPNRGWELEGKTVGIIGFGATGTAVAKKLTTFKCNLLAYDTYSVEQQSNLVHFVPLQEIYDNCDIVTYHVPLNEQTSNYYDGTLFKKPHILINTSRGPIASTEAILKAFKTGNLIGACLDVLDFEHIQPFTGAEKNKINDLLAHNCIITPHIAGYSFDAIEKMSAELQFQLSNLIG